MDKTRPICSVCKKKSAAVNYHKDGETFYRTKCDSCIRRQKKQQVSRIPVKIKSDI